MSAVNRFDSPAQDRYFNTYVPLPYEQIMPVIAARQAQLEREQEMLNKTFEDTKNIKYIPGTKDESYVRDYLGNVSGLVDKYYGADLSDPVVKQQMRSAFSKMTNKQNIQNIQSSYDAWATNQKYKAELKAKGLYDPLIDEDPATLGQWDTVGSGKVYDYIAPAYKNPQPVADEYFKPLKPSDLGPIGDYMYSGVDEKRIDEVVDAQWSNFANTSEGNQYVRKMAKQSGQDPNDPDVRETIAKEYLRDRGYSAFIYTDRGNMTPEAQMRLAKGKKDEDTKYLNTTQRQPLRPGKHDPFAIGDIKFNDKDEVWIEPKYGDVPTSSGYGSISGSIPARDIDIEERERKISEQKAKLDFVRKQIPALTNLSDKETYNAYKQLIGYVPEDLPQVDLPDIPRKKIASYLASSLSNRDIAIIDSKGSSSLTNINDTGKGSALEDLGMSVAELRGSLEDFANGKSGSRVTVSGLAQNAPKNGMIALDIVDKSRKGGKDTKGTIRKVLIDSNEEFSAIMAPTNEIYNNIRNFQSGTTIIGYSPSVDKMTAVRVIPNAFRDEKTNKWKYDYKLEEGYMEDGEFVPVGETTMQAIIRTQNRLLDNSELINSNINYTPNPSPSF